MIQIRKGVFETNSSSTHSICISKAPVITYPKRVDFYTGNYGWGRNTVCDTASYLYTALYQMKDKVRMSELKKILNKHGVECNFHKPKSDDDFYMDCGIDHCYELSDFISELFSDEDLLMRYLFSSDSHVHTGNDNGCGPEYEDPAYEAESRVCGDDCEMIDNPLHDPEHYNYFFKGN